ncbi:flagellar hook protein FlgE [Kushneria phyllosphaerae]|uniref:Flagellar hook protein FlgE n=1 Tax=Kushneria phyllosphaerae TaxID=2100822 RepID=A0A2R8CPP5_9GAMM|nr:flagellar hook protein FlgE [Kushneria phyllosphaerae]SPJ34878.1 Flagellar hook protein FlgE [Kushneria phyllosphaerae]
MAFTQGVSGLNAASSQLDTIGHNIANSQTVGFKKSRTEFADLYAGAKAGLGVQVSAITQAFSQGAMESTDRDLDLAIQGGGFFRLTDGQQVSYSRNGQFQMDSNGFLVNNTGGRLMGYPVDDPTSANPVVLAGAQPVALQVAQGDLDASATTSGSMTFNLDSTDTAKLNAAGDPIAFDATNPKSYNWQTSLTTYDSQGNAQQVNLYFVKSETPNTWDVHALNKGVEIVSGGGPKTLSFDPNGKITGDSNLALDLDPQNGANRINATIDLSSITQNSGSFVVKAAGQNGYAAGSLTGVSIADNGDVLGKYSNNQSRALGRVALAGFTNEQGLKPDGNNAWLATTDSGQELLGSAGTGQLGSLRSQTLENSNVDLAAELVTMIVAQRNYQANAQTIKTQDQILQTMVNLR